MRRILKQLVIVDADTGERDDCGAIAEMRKIGRFNTWLTYKQFEGEDNGIWWIVTQASDETTKTLKLGYREERREVCWEDFMRLTEPEIEDQMTRSEELPS